MNTPRQLDLINTPDDFRLIGNDHQTQLEAEALAVNMQTKEDANTCPTCGRIGCITPTYWNGKLYCSVFCQREAQAPAPMDTHKQKETQPRTDNPRRLKDALIMLAKVAGDYSPWNWNLAGPHNAAARQLILSTLIGCRIPKASAGVNALAKAFYAAGPELDYTCQRDLEKKYHDWARTWLLNYKED